jgi:drug/metabolite transporter superfamily protein YnfA
MSEVWAAHVVDTVQTDAADAGRARSSQGGIAMVTSSVWPELVVLLLLLMS